MKLSGNIPPHWRIVIIITLVVTALIGLSYAPISKWTSGRLSDINIISDLVDIEHESDTADDNMLAQEELDPFLEQEFEIDTRQIDTSAVAEGDTPIIAIQPSRQGNDVVIEDYTPGGYGLVNLRNAIAAGRVAHIAMVGDSYIEGDIFAQDLRDLMQQNYGGHGVGYVNMYSEFPGFRRSIRQSGGSGWKEFKANGKYESRYMGITQHYYQLRDATESIYKGTDALSRTGSWNRSTFVFSSPSDADIVLTTSTDTLSLHITGSPLPQAVTVPGKTSIFKVKSSSPSLIGYGVWLTDSTGVSLDCMSSRGFSGVTLSAVNSDLTSQLRRHIDYSLIILEFGINAVSAKQTNYSSYANKMVRVINHLQACYPGADILILGIGDRGQKRGSEVHSMQAVGHMIDAQREAARKAHCLFWDTREAMGGEDAIVTWVANGWANKDYVHLNHKGGKQLAEYLYKAIVINIDK